MLMNEKIIFDRTYCINSAETKEIRCRNERNMVHHILQPHNIFIRIKALVFMLVPGGLQVLITSTCFAWRPVTSISKSQLSMFVCVEAYRPSQQLFSHVGTEPTLPGFNQYCRELMCLA